MKDIKSIMKAALETETVSETETACHPDPDSIVTFRHGDFEYRLASNGMIDLARYHGDEEKVFVPSKVLVPGREKEDLVDCVMIGAFMYKDNVREVVLEEGIEHVVGAFMMCPALETVHLPSTLKNTHGGAVKGCRSFRGFTVSEDNPVYEAKDGFLIHKESRELVCGPRDLVECVIPEGVEKIGAFAFEYCLRLESLTVPEGVREIDVCAFAQNPMLWEVQLPASLENIGAEAFCDCPRLTNLAVPAGVTFDGCPERDFGLIMGSYDDIDEDE